VEPEGWIIRRATPPDLPRCAEVFVAAFAEPPYCEDWSLEMAQERLGAFLERCPADCFCAEWRDEVVGLAFCTSIGAQRAVLEELAVAPEAQGQGLGAALLRHCLEHFRARGLARLELVARRDAPAFEFYRRLGFRPTQRYVLMVKEL